MFKHSPRAKIYRALSVLAYFLILLQISSIISSNNNPIPTSITTPNSTEDGFTSTNVETPFDSTTSIYEPEVEFEETTIPLGQSLAMSSSIPNQIAYHIPSLIPSPDDLIMDFTLMFEYETDKYRRPISHNNDINAADLLKLKDDIYSEPMAEMATFKIHQQYCDLGTSGWGGDYLGASWFQDQTLSHIIWGTNFPGYSLATWTYNKLNFYQPSPEINDGTTVFKNHYANQKISFLYLPICEAGYTNGIPNSGHYTFEYGDQSFSGMATQGVAVSAHVVTTNWIPGQTMRFWSDKPFTHRLQAIVLTAIEARPQIVQFQPIGDMDHIGTCFPSVDLRMIAKVPYALYPEISGEVMTNYEMFDGTLSSTTISPIPIQGIEYPAYIGSNIPFFIPINDVFLSAGSKIIFYLFYPGITVDVINIQINWYPHVFVNHFSYIEWSDNNLDHEFRETVQDFSLIPDTTWSKLSGLTQNDLDSKVRMTMAGSLTPRNQDFPEGPEIINTYSWALLSIHIQSLTAPINIHIDPQQISWDVLAGSEVTIKGVYISIGARMEQYSAKPTGSWHTDNPTDFILNPFETPIKFITSDPNTFSIDKISYRFRVGSFISDEYIFLATPISGAIRNHELMITNDLNSHLLQDFGSFSVTITIQNQYHHYTTIERQFRYDTTAPQFTEITPSQRALTNNDAISTATFTLYITEYGGLTHLEFQLNGEPYNEIPLDSLQLIGSGLYSTDFEIPASILTALPKGPHLLTFRATDVAGNIDWFSIDIHHNPDAPIINNLPASFGTIGSAPAAFTISIPEYYYNTTYIGFATEPYLYLYDNAAPIIFDSDPTTNPTLLTIDMANLGTAGLDFGDLPEGPNSLIIMVFNLASSTIAEIPFTKDTAAPTITIVSSPTVCNSPPSVEFSLFDYSGLTILNYVVGGHTIDLSPASYTVGTSQQYGFILESSHFNELLQGPFTITISGQDTFGHNIDQEFTIIKDTEVPGFTSLFAENTFVNDAFDFEFTITDWSLLFTKIYIDSTANPNMLVGTFLSAGSHIVSVDIENAMFGLGDGAHSLLVYSEDQMGYTSTYTRSFIIDREGPEVYIQSPLEGSCYSSEFSLTLDILNGDTLSKIEFAVEDSAFFTISGLTIGSGDIPVLYRDYQGTLSFDFRFTDLAGNIYVVANFPLIHDSIKPTVIINIPEPAQKFGAIAPEYELSISDANLGEYGIIFDDQEYALTSLAGTIPAHIWNLYGEFEGHMLFYAYDLAGNRVQVGLQITIDQVGPRIKVNAPTQNSAADLTAPWFWITVDDMNFRAAFYEINGINYTIDLSEMENGNLQGNIDAQAWRDAYGEYVYITFHAIDDLNNIGYSETIAIKRSDFDPTRRASGVENYFTDLPIPIIAIFGAVAIGAVTLTWHLHKKQLVEGQ